MGAAFMNKFLTVLGIYDKVNSEDIEENEDIERETFADVENNEISNNFFNDTVVEQETVTEEDNNEEEKSTSGFSFYKSKKNKEKEIDDYVPNISRRSQSKVLPMSSSSTTKMIISKPSSFDDVKDIADNVKARKSVIVNLEAVSHEDGRRIIDFLSGTGHALDGTIQKVSKLIFLIAPKNIEVQDDTEKYNYSSKLNMSWLKK